MVQRLNAGSDGLRCRVVDTLDGLEPYEGEWERLAVECGKPTSRPGWLRPWWEASCAPADHGSRVLRVAMVSEGERLVAVFPMFVVDGNSAVPEMRLLGQRAFWTVEPLLSDDAPGGTAAVVAQALSQSAPRTARVTFDLVSTRGQWPGELRRRWHGGPAWMLRGRETTSLVIEGPISSEEWVASRSPSWRTEYRRLARRRADAGLEIRRSETPDEVEADVRALARLHHARFNWGPSWLTQQVEEALVQIARLFVGSGDLRVWKVVREEELVAATLFARGGDVTEVLLTAFDPAWTNLGPGLASMVAGIRNDLDTGARLIDFGWGGFKYLQRLSNAARTGTAYELFPGNRTMPIALGRWLVPNARQHLRPRSRLRAWLGA